MSISSDLNNKHTRIIHAQWYSLRTKYSDYNYLYCKEYHIILIYLVDIYFVLNVILVLLKGILSK
jgi:hypothetical protein